MPEILLRETKGEETYLRNGNKTHNSLQKTDKKLTRG